MRSHFSQHLAITKLQTLELPDEATCSALASNQKLIAFGLLDCTTRVFHATDTKHVLTLYGHSLPVTCVAMSADSKLIATGSLDKSVKIWGLDFGDCHRSLFAHDEA